MRHQERDKGTKGRRDEGTKGRRGTDRLLFLILFLVHPCSSLGIFFAKKKLLAYIKANVCVYEPLRNAGNDHEVRW